MTRPAKGKFITIEGTEGVGKSTNIAFLQSLIEAAGYRLLVTREPGGTPLAEEIRQLLLVSRTEAVDPTAELLLMFAARAQHLHTLIEPALNAGQWVLSDRFTDATFAYQGGGRGLDQSVIGQLEGLVQVGVQPDVTFYLDIDVQAGLERARERGELDRFEQEDVAFFERVRNAYLDRVRQHPERFVVIDAAQPLEQVQQDLAFALQRYL